MKHTITITLLTILISYKVFGDVGDCVKYKVVIQLNKGTKITGFVYVGGYEKRFKFQDISFLDYIKKFPSDTLHVYKNIRQLKYPITNEGIENCGFRFDATTDDNHLKILKTTLKEINVISYTTCNNCDIADEENGYYWNGISPTIITELNKDEIDLLQTTPTAAIAFGHDFDDNTEAYWMISYSKEYGQKDLEKLKQDFLIEANRLLRERKWDIVQENYRALKEELRGKSIILFKISYAL